jgi:hypothetical protein
MKEVLKMFLTSYILPIIILIVLTLLLRPIKTIRFLIKAFIFIMAILIGIGILGIFVGEIANFVMNLFN